MIEWTPRLHPCHWWRPRHWLATACIWRAERLDNAAVRWVGRARKLKRLP